MLVIASCESKLHWMSFTMSSLSEAHSINCFILSVVIDQQALRDLRRNDLEFHLRVLKAALMITRNLFLSRLNSLQRIYRNALGVNDSFTAGTSSLSSDNVTQLDCLESYFSFTFGLGSALLGGCTFD